MEQVGDQWVESYKKVISRVREDSGKIDLRRFLLKAGQAIRHPWEMVENRELEQI